METNSEVPMFASQTFVFPLSVTAVSFLLCIVFNPGAKSLCESLLKVHEKSKVIQKDPLVLLKVEQLFFPDDIAQRP